MPRPTQTYPTMSTSESANLPSASIAAPTDRECLNDRLAEAACYAVLRRLMPVLRHDVAGSMQPVRMLMMVLERRVHAPEPDVQAITKSVVSVSALTKQANADCINALDWIGSSQDAQVSLRSSVDEAIKLLAMELSANALVLVNGISDDTPTAPQSFLRTVFMGSLLAFCDHCTAGGTLKVTFEAATSSHSSHRLELRLLQDDAVKPPAFQGLVRKYRLMDWHDVQAMARPFGVAVTQGDGWLTLDLPKN